MKDAVAKIKLKIESPMNVLIHRINKTIYGRKNADQLKWDKQCSGLRKKYFKNGIWNFNGIKLPEYTVESVDWFMYAIYMDIFFVYCTHNDNYDSSLIDELDNYLYDGTFGYRNSEIDVTVKKNAVVIDAGAWIGDFSAYASVKGAQVFAFEPCSETYEYLKETQKLNQNIEIIKKGLGDKQSISYLSKNFYSWENKIEQEGDIFERIEITSLDEFVAENNIKRIDFIKADIEGHERYMLIGAKNVLKNFGPKLAICTYHLPDDPEVLAKIILDANPNYKIVQKRKKLYAMVRH